MAPPPPPPPLLYSRVTSTRRRMEDWLQQSVWTSSSLLEWRGLVSKIRGRIIPHWGSSTSESGPLQMRPELDGRCLLLPLVGITQRYYTVLQEVRPVLPPSCVSTVTLVLNGLRRDDESQAIGSPFPPRLARDRIPVSLGPFGRGVFFATPAAKWIANICPC